MDSPQPLPASPTLGASFTSLALEENEVEYFVRYRNVTTKELVYEYQTDGVVVESELERDSGSKNQKIFDIVTVFHTQEKPEPGAARKPSPVKSTGTVSMHIKSPAIINALRAVVEYYPSQDLFGDTVIIPAPYAVLVHHRKELSEFREKTSHAEQSDEICFREKEASRHIQTLLDFLEKNIMAEVREEEERNARGFETFKMAWVAMKPGTTYRFVYTGKLGVEVGAVIHTMSGGSFQDPAVPWLLRYWTWDFNGSFLGQRFGEAVAQKWDGERNINYFIPEKSVFEDPSNAEKISRELIARGEKFYSLLTKRCHYYKGTTVDFPYHKIDGLVMVDMKTYYASDECPVDRVPEVQAFYKDTAWVSDCTCPVCKRRVEAKTTATRKAPFLRYNSVYPEDGFRVTPHQHFLLPSMVWGFVFKTRTWEKLDVSGFEEPAFQTEMIDQLVINPERRKTLKALASNYIRKNHAGESSDMEMWSADFIAGKGQGIIFLLHGRPGVGKTYTAECVAEYAQRPLMLLTSSDIGTSPENVEFNLTKQFKRASSWGAVLLIDEADVFMERRSTNDLNRNSLVAGFLRSLEYYDGILFLTTNRVGNFDDAFISRIHVQLYYPDFTDEDRKQVWRTFMDKLRKERGQKMRVSIEAKEYIMDGKEIKQVKWNGREIRNAFQTAVALAEYEAEKDEEGKILLKDDHLKSIVEMSRDFKNYLDKLHRGDEGKRAEREYSRLAEDGEQFSRDEYGN